MNRQQPVFLLWLWQSRNGWREGAGYSPEIIAGVRHQLSVAVPECRVVCIADECYHEELYARRVEFYPLWDIHGGDRLSRHGFDCHARLGLWGEPGQRMRERLGFDIVQWLDADVMISPQAGPVLLKDWHEQPEMFWVPRSLYDLSGIFAFGKNKGTWLGINGSMARLQLGSKPQWWEALKDPAWVAETEAHICGSDQAALTRLALEERGEEWRTGNPAIFDLPSFGKSVQPYGQTNQWEVAFFPYDLDTDFTKPWLSANAYLKREWRILCGFATEAEVRAEMHPGLRRYRGKR